MIDAKDLKYYVIQPVLSAMEPLWPGASNPAAVNLLLGTAFQESNVGGVTHLRQIGGGPGLGIYQIETATHDDIWETYLGTRPEKASFVRGLASQNMREDRPFHDDLISNLRYQTVIARIKYWRRKFNWPMLVHPGTKKLVIDPGNI